MTLNSSEDIVFETCFEDLSEFFLDSFYKDIAPFGIKLNGFNEGEVVSSGYLFDISVNNYNGYYLYGLATLPEFRKQGRMTKLLNEIEQKAIKNGKKFLYLATNNCKAEELYKGFGFKKLSFPYKTYQKSNVKENFIECSIEEFINNTNSSIEFSESLRFSMINSLKEDVKTLKSENGFVLFEPSENMVLDFYPKTEEFMKVVYNSFNKPKFFFNEYSFMVKSLNDDFVLSEFSYILH